MSLKKSSDIKKQAIKRFERRELIKKDINIKISTLVER